PVARLITTLRLSAIVLPLGLRTLTPRAKRVIAVRPDAWRLHGARACGRVTWLTHRMEGAPPMSASPYVVETKGLTKRFGPRVAVDGVDLRIPAGSAFGYLGPNGAGKTTLIRMLLGLTGATAGSMRLLGLDMPARRAAAPAPAGATVEEP